MNNSTYIVGMDLHSEKVALAITQRVPNGKPKKTNQIECTVRELVRTYQKRVPKDSVTVVEASTNTFKTVDKLAAYGYTVKVVTADAVTGCARRDTINDNIDAYNLAVVYASGCAREVYVPDRETIARRSLCHCHESAKKLKGMAYNQLVELCIQHGLERPSNRSEKLVVTYIESLLEGDLLTDTEKLIFRFYLKNYQNAIAALQETDTEIAKIVDADEVMQRVMTIVGIGVMTTFSLVAHVGDIRRFKNSKCLVSYIGLRPRLVMSGTSEGSNKLTYYGISDLRSLFVEGAQSVYRCSNENCGRWGRSAVRRGKPYNKIICAIARKLVTFAFHAMRGDPIPAKEPTENFLQKMRKVGAFLGKEAIKKRGYKTFKEYAAQTGERIWKNVESFTPSTNTHPHKTQMDKAL